MVYAFQFFELKFCVTRATKTTARILIRRVEKEIGGRGSTDAFGVLRVISGRTLEIDEELCACCVDWQKAFDGVN